MNILLIILFALLLALAAGLIIWYLLFNRLEKKSNRVMSITIAVVGILFFESLLITTAILPTKADKFLLSSITRIENNINAISDGYVNQTLNVEQVKNVLLDYNQMEAYLKSSSEVSWIVRIIGANAYIDYLTKFVNSIDTNLYEMEQQNIDITIHNIFIRLHEQSKEPIFKITKILEIIVIVLSFIFVFMLIILWVILMNDEKTGDRVFVQPQQ